MSGFVAKQFFEIRMGDTVSDGSRTYRVTHLISVDSLLGKDVESGQTRRLRIETLKLGPTAPPDAPAAPEPAADQDLSAYSDEDWREAQRRFEAIKPLIAQPLRTARDVDRIAEANGVSRPTMYRWLREYLNAGHVSALVPARPGRKFGHTMLDEPVELIVRAVIDDTFLTKQRLKAADVIEEVNRRCRLAKVAAPHPNTVRARLGRLDVSHQLRRRGRQEEARNRFSPVRGAFPGADHPLAVVQIDHTPVDIIVVDEVHRKPVGRPYVTVAIDVFSRMVAGFYLSLEAPGAAAVGLCLAQAMCPKREYLAALGVPGDWPLWGRPRTVHCDNAKEFRGGVLERGCQEYGIDLEWRPVKTPHYGGNIERIMGTLAREVHKLPGTTFSGPRERRGYDSEKEAVLTLRELEAHLADFFVNVYHQRVHSELGMSPKRKWEQGILGDADTPGASLMPLPHDPLRIQLDFMPFFERTVQRYGIQIDEVTYYDPLLDRYIGATDPANPQAKRRFVVRRDPRDISKVHFFDPIDARYYPIAYRDLGHPAVSEWELREARRGLLEAGRRDVDEVLIFEAIERKRARVADATHKSKAARRQAHRDPAGAAARAARKPAGSPPPAPSVPSGTAVPEALAALSTLEDDPFAQPVRPYDEILMRR